MLLTGATGFVGAFLLEELLRRTDAEVVCLVRAADEARAGQRLRENMSKYGLNPPGFGVRTVPLPGDFSKPRLGLSPGAFDALAKQIDTIYHNGANVNLSAPYEVLRRTNVFGTQEILRLSCRSRLKPVHFVSTFTVAATAARRGRLVLENDPLPRCEDLMHGYSQTKWVSEKMIGAARSRGIPVSIYRPGHVSGHSESGVSNAADLLHSILLACYRLGTTPTRSSELDMTPVDYVAAGIVELSLQSGSLGGTFHLTNPHPLQPGQLSEWLRREHLGMRPIAYERWRKQLLALAEQVPVDGMKFLIDTMVPEGGDPSGAAPALHPQYDCRQATAALDHVGIACPACDERLLSVYLTNARQQGLIPSAG